MCLASSWLANRDLESLLQEYRIRFGYYEPHAKQKLFHDLGLHAVERVFLAGNGTGKTYCGALEVCMHLTGVYPSWWAGRRYTRPITAWVLGESNEVVRTTLQQYYVGALQGTPGGLDPGLIVKRTWKSGVNDAVDMVWVRHRHGGLSSVAFKSYEQGRKKVQSAKVDIVHCDEEPPESIYQELLMRTMRVADSLFLITATPLSGLTNVIRGFLEVDGVQLREGQIVHGRTHVSASWDDNPYLPESEKERMRLTMSPHERDIRERGIPSLGSGLVYPVSDSQVVVDPFPIPEHWARVYGLDFGWNPSPTAAVFAAHDRDADVLYLTAEYAATELTPQKHAVHLLTMGANWMPGVFDPAGKISAQKDGEKLIHLYRDAGLRCLVPANNSKEEGVMRVLERMQSGRLKIVSTLRGVLSEWRVYSRDDTGIIKKGNDHYMDCMRYIVMSGLSVAQPLRPLVSPVRSMPSTGQHWMGG